MRHKKVKNLKFLRNIIICITSLLIVEFIVNTAPGYKIDKYKDRINLIINEENRTEDLKHDIYINEKGTIYISEEDVKNLFDATIYHDQKYNQIITTSNTKVANIVIDEKQMIVNNSIVSMLDSIIKIDNNIYLPISDMSIVYNINIKYIKNTNKVIIDELDKGMINAKVTKESNIKFRPRALSKNIGILKQGETVSCFYITSKGWRQIRTSDGTIGYIKNDKLTAEYIVRQDMIQQKEAVKIEKSMYIKDSFNISDGKEIKTVILNSIFNINNGNVTVSQNKGDIEDSNKLWACVSNKSVEMQTNSLLQDYKTRTKLIDEIISNLIQNDINGLSIEFSQIDKENIIRFVIELTPKLKEIGITTCIVLDSNMEKQDYINIVDYIVE
ncbi:MAG: stalk domain-containing protein [Clostridia bacterium]|nr:stalk domain-containing protein [Clostridia bacterium]